MPSVEYLQIEPTTRCNFTCGFCAGRSMPQADLVFEQFEKTLAAFPDLRHLELQGEGESLMHPRFFDMVALARSRDIRVCFITNGSFFRPETIDRILELGVEKLSVSIESPDAAEFQAIRGGKLEKVRRGIEDLLRARRERGLDRPVVGMSITVLRRTRAQLPAIIALYKELGLDGGLTVQPLQRMGSYAKNYSEDLARESFTDDEAEAIWVKFLANREIKKLQDARGSKDTFYDELMVGWEPRKRSCPWLDKGLYVNNEGWATPCCMVKDTARFGLGKVGVDAPSAILEKRDALRQELANGQIPAPCEGCELARYATMSLPGLMRAGVRGVVHRFFGKLED